MDNEHVRRICARRCPGHELSPVLIIRGKIHEGLPTQIADGYHWGVRQLPPGREHRHPQSDHRSRPHFRPMSSLPCRRRGHPVRRCGLGAGRFALRTAGGTRPDQSDAGLTDAVAFVGRSVRDHPGPTAGLRGPTLRRHARHRPAGGCIRGRAVQRGEPLPEADRNDERRSVICYMRAGGNRRLGGLAAGRPTGAENAAAWAGRIQQRIDQLPLNSLTRESTHYFMVENPLQLDSDRSLRLQLLCRRSRWRSGS